MMTPTSTPFQLGDPVTYRGIVVTPVFPALDPRASYITLDEALPRGLVITETSDAGSVPELAVVNPLADNVLLYDGEELVGAKQNRILNVSVLVGAGAKLPIPVSCVEQGRWARSSVSGNSIATAPRPMRTGLGMRALPSVHRAFGRAGSASSSICAMRRHSVTPPQTVASAWMM